MKKISHALTTLAAINFALSPAIAIEPPVTESLASIHNSFDSKNSIEDIFNTNYRRCIYLVRPGIWWCFSWGE